MARTRPSRQRGSSLGYAGSLALGSLFETYPSNLGRTDRFWEDGQIWAGERSGTPLGTIGTTTDLPPNRFAGATPFHCRHHVGALQWFARHLVWPIPRPEPRPGDSAAPLMVHRHPIGRTRLLKRPWPKTQREASPARWKVDGSKDVGSEEMNGSTARIRKRSKFGVSEELAAERVSGTTLPPIRGSAVFRSTMKPCVSQAWSCIFSSPICGVAACALESALPGETEWGSAGEHPRKG